MWLGIMADTHDCLPMIKVAVKRLNDEHVELVLHAGDFIAPFVALHFKLLKPRLIGVFGNNDGDKKVLPRRFAEIGAEIRGSFTEVKISGLRFALLHGHDTHLLESSIKSGRYEVVIHGHTHQAKVYRKNGVLVINPGEVCGYLSGKATLALFNTETCEVRVIRLRGRDR